jgi:UDP-N-acetylmuramoyl-L-alanyl-D-glutamate--2,6-diaminopimelate ligase
LRLADILRRLPDAAGLPPTWRGAGALDLAGVTADSRRAGPGMLFAALPGSRADGRTFIGEAVARGAAAVLAPCGTAWPADVPARVLLEDAEPRRRLAQLAALLAGPQPDVVAAVTGTNGKTSTVEFLRQIWTLGGHRAASLGTLGVIAPDFEPGAG